MLPQLSSQALASAYGPVQKARIIEAWIAVKLAEVLDLDPKDIDFRQPFASFGLGSMQQIAIAGELEEWLGRRLSPTVFWDYPNIQALTSHLVDADQSPGSGTEIDSDGSQGD